MQSVFVYLFVREFQLKVGKWESGKQSNLGVFTAEARSNKIHPPPKKKKEILFTDLRLRVLQRFSLPRILVASTGRHFGHVLRV